MLLGIRTAFKTDLNATTAELVYGEPLHLPGEFFEQHQQPAEHPYLTELRRKFHALVAVQPVRHGSEKILVLLKLATCSHVFVRIDRQKRKLQSPYEGPFALVERRDNVFVVNIRNKNTLSTSSA